MSTNSIIHSALNRATIERMQHATRVADQQAATNGAGRKNRDEGIGKLTDNQRSSLKLWRRDFYNPALTSLESRVRIKGAL